MAERVHHCQPTLLVDGQWLGRWLRQQFFVLDGPGWSSRLKQGSQPRECTLLPPGAVIRSVGSSADCCVRALSKSVSAACRAVVEIVRDVEANKPVAISVYSLS
jgi:hypothetical protein